MASIKNLLLRTSMFFLGTGTLSSCFTHTPNGKWENKAVTVFSKEKVGKEAVLFTFELLDIPGVKKSFYPEKTETSHQLDSALALGKSYIITADLFKDPDLVDYLLPTKIASLDRSKADAIVSHPAEIEGHISANAVMSTVGKVR